MESFLDLMLQSTLLIVVLFPWLFPISVCLALNEILVVSVPLLLFGFEAKLVFPKYSQRLFSITSAKGLFEVLYGDTSFVFFEFCGDFCLLFTRSFNDLSVSMITESLSSLSGKLGFRLKSKWHSSLLRFLLMCAGLLHSYFKFFKMSFVTSLSPFIATSVS